MKKNHHPRTGAVCYSPTQQITTIDCYQETKKKKINKDWEGDAEKEDWQEGVRAEIIIIPHTQTFVWPIAVKKK